MKRTQDGRGTGMLNFLGVSGAAGKTEYRGAPSSCPWFSPESLKPSGMHTGRLVLSEQDPTVRKQHRQHSVTSHRTTRTEHTYTHAQGHFAVVGGKHFFFVFFFYSFFF